MTEHPLNRWVRRECEAHADDYHHDCPETGAEWCAFYVDIAECPDCGAHINPDLPSKEKIAV